MIGIYVHHHGSGHRTRARLLAGELRARGHEVSLLGSDAGEGIALPLDHDGPGGTYPDPTAGGRLHWAPLHQRGLAERTALLAAWVREHRPSVVVVDVSVEVALFLRLMGVPVVLVAQPGERTDAAHELALDVAAAVIAPWPSWADLCPALERAGERVHRVGGLSRFAPGPSSDDRRSSPHGRSSLSRPPSVQGVVLTGSGGLDDPRLPEEIVSAVPGLDWTVLDGRVWVDDPSALLRQAAVVVTHAGQNALADVAACGVPAVVVPQQRPFAEQEHTARALEAAGLAVVPLPGPDGRVDWVASVAAARSRPPSWERWETEGALGRAAAVVLEVAGG